jgi:N-acetylmuramoyl-L-alanine amidase
MTASLVELAYLSNEADAIKLIEDQCQFAFGIYIGILRYFGFA